MDISTNSSGPKPSSSAKPSSYFITMPSKWFSMLRSRGKAVANTNPSSTLSITEVQAPINSLFASTSASARESEIILFGEEIVDEIRTQPPSRIRIQTQDATQTSATSNCIWAEDLKRIVGLDEVYGGKSRIKEELMAEFVGTFLLVLIGCCASASTTELDVVQTALAFGIIVATLTRALGPISGAHFNPAVTLGLLLVGDCGLFKAVYYFCAQCVGAICGAAALRALLISEDEGEANDPLGATELNHKLNSSQALALEALATFVWVFVVCGCRKKSAGSWGPISIGLGVTACHLMAIPFTGCSMNPARSLGPALLTRAWSDHWVYWIGPLVGGGAAGIVYANCFQYSEEDTKTKSCRVRNS